jgi:hypothetical protein
VGGALESEDYFVEREGELHVGGCTLSSRGGTVVK